MVVFLRQYRFTDNRKLRDASIMAHLGGAIPSPMYDSSLLISGIAPREVPWSQVALHVCNRHVTRSQILYAFNGTLVGLCVADKSEVCSLYYYGIDNYMHGFIEYIIN